MKIELTTPLELVITPETAVEEIALRVWSKYYDYKPADANTARATMLIRSLADGAGDDRLRKAAEALIDYRRRAGPLNFQLEKADAYLREIGLALEGEGNDG